MSNSRIGQRRCGLWSLGFLWIMRSSPFLYLLGEYLVNQGKLNCKRPNYRSSESAASVFTMAGVMSEGSEEVDSLKTFDLLFVLVC